MDTTSVAPPRPRTAARTGVPQPRQARGRGAGTSAVETRPRTRSAGATGSRPSAAGADFRVAGARDAAHSDAGRRDADRRSASARSAVRVHPATGVQLPAIPFVLLVLGLLGGGLVCLLVVNTTLGATSFRISQLQSANAKLSLREQTLLGQVADDESPQRIADRAYQLGMRSQTDGQILNLPAGRFDQVPSHPGAQGLDSAIGQTPSASSTPSPGTTGVAKSGDTKSAGAGKAHKKPAARSSRKRRRHKTATPAGSGR